MATSFTCIERELELPPQVKKLLPSSYHHHVCDVQDRPDGGFFCVLRLPLKTKEEVKHWLKSFENSSLTTWRTSRSHPENSLKRVFKGDYHCHHNTKPRCHRVLKPHKKNTDCPAKLTIVVKKIAARLRSKDKHLPALPAVIRLTSTHNHSTQSASSLRFRPVSEEVKMKFLQMYELGYTPASAYHLHRKQLYEQHEDDYHLVMADRSQSPSVAWCHNIYTNVFKKLHGASRGPASLKNLQDAVNSYNVNCNKRGFTSCCSLNVHKEGFCLAVCSPLMKRTIEKLPNCSEIIFVDSSGALDRFGCRVFILLTHSVAGGIPIGVLMMTSEAQEMMEEGLNLLKQVIPPQSIFAQEGPKLVLTDECTALMTALSETFPNSTHLLSIFHVLQAAWSYLWDENNGIPLYKRTDFHNQIKRMLYSDSEENLTETCNEILSAEMGEYPKLTEYVFEIYERRHLWALCYREELLTQGYNSYNLTEAAVKVLKDRVLLQTKAFSIVQLFHFLTDGLEDCYKQRIDDLLNSRFEKVQKSKYMYLGNFTKKNVLNNLQVSKISDCAYSVKNEANATTCIVDVSIGSCTCNIGITGGPCKHQYAVTQHDRETVDFVPVTDNDTKRVLQFIVTEAQSVCEVFPEGWHLPLKLSSKDSSQSNPTTDNISEIDELRIGATVECISVEPASDDFQCDQSSSPESGFVSASRLFSNTVRRDLEKVFENIKEKMDTYPDVFLPSISAFLKQYNSMSDEDRVAAFHNFGKNTGVAVPLSKQQGGPTGEQPTAVARRKRSLGQRLCNRSGRPPKHSLESMHMGKRKGQPHHFVHQIQNSIALGTLLNIKSSPPTF